MSSEVAPQHYIDFFSSSFNAIVDQERKPGIHIQTHPLTNLDLGALADPDFIDPTKMIVLQEKLGPSSKIKYKRTVSIRLNAKRFMINAYVTNNNIHQELERIKDELNTQNQPPSEIESVEDDKEDPTELTEILVRFEFLKKTRENQNDSINLDDLIDVINGLSYMSGVVPDLEQANDSLFSFFNRQFE